VPQRVIVTTGGNWLGLPCCINAGYAADYGKEKVVLLTLRLGILIFRSAC